MSEQRGRILLVDDEEDISSGIRQLLEKQFSFYVRTARTGLQAKQELAKDTFDVVVLDWILRAGDGREVIEFIRSTSPNTHIIVYSGRDGSDSECTAAGADQFVEKGPETQTLRNAVERAVLSAKDRIQGTEADHGTASWFAAAILEELGNLSIVGDNHCVVLGADETIGSGVAVEMAEEGRFGQVIKQFRVPGDLDPREELFGSCSDLNSSPRLTHGVLESPKPFTLILQDPDNLCADAQLLLADALRNRSFSRCGSDRKLPVDCRLIVVHRPVKPLKFVPEFQILFENSAVELTERPKNPVSAFSKLVKRRLGIDVQVSRTLPYLQKFHDSTFLWPRLIAAAESIQRADLPGGESQRTVDIEDAGLSIYESVMCDLREKNGKHMPKWSDVERILEATYICQILNETGGNLSDAAKQSGISKNTLYKRLQKYEIDSDDFKQCNRIDAAASE